MAGAILGVRDTAQNKVPVLMELAFWWDRGIVNKSTTVCYIRQC